MLVTVCFPVRASVLSPIKCALIEADPASGKLLVSPQMPSL